MRERGRPREFRDKTRNISLTISGRILRWIDDEAVNAGVSRARIINELLRICWSLNDTGFVEIDDSGTAFRQFPRKRVIDFGDEGSMTWDGIEEGFAFFATRDRVCETSTTKEKGKKQSAAGTKSGKQRQSSATKGRKKRGRGV